MRGSARAAEVGQRSTGWAGDGSGGAEGGQRAGKGPVVVRPGGGGPVTDQDLARRLADAERCCPAGTTVPVDRAGSEDLAKAFSALGDPVRLHVLDILAAAPGGEVCVCELVEPLGRSQPTVSHHLKVLSDAGLIHGERRGKWVWYSLDDARLASLRAALDARRRKPRNKPASRLRARRADPGLRADLVASAGGPTDDPGPIT